MTTLIKLIASDGQQFEVPKPVALQSKTIKDILEDIGDESTLPIPNVTGTILKKVIQYCEYHSINTTTAAAATGGDSKEIIPWDAEFCKVTQDELFELILASSYLNIDALLTLTCKTVAAMIHGKTPQQIRELFDIKNDFTPEEEAQVMRENEWGNSGGGGGDTTTK
jgi:S-phase kinase-associated protein 1